jgi:putative transposase
MRRPTFNEPGHAHELTFTCHGRYQFLAAERTCEWLAASINAARDRFDFALWAYVFMPEHVHLLIYPRRSGYNIAEILKAIKAPVGRQAVAYLEEHAPEWLPRITVQRGSRTERRFWLAGGGYDRNLWETKAIEAVIEYIHANPVRRGLVSRAADWKWSSACWWEQSGRNSLEPDKLDLSLIGAAF